MENRIKEQQLDLFADRTSCHSWWSNQMRLILSSLAYILLQKLRDTALKDTQLAKATAGTIRNKLLKIGVVITRNTRRIRLKMASSYPLKQIFKIVVKQLAREWKNSACCPQHLQIMGVRGSCTQNKKIVTVTLQKSYKLYPKSKRFKTDTARHRFVPSHEICGLEEYLIKQLKNPTWKFQNA